MKFLAQLLLCINMHLLLGRYAWGEDDQPKSTQLISISTFDGLAVFRWNQPAVICHTLTVGVMIGAGGAAGRTGTNTLGQKEMMSS